MTDDEEIGQIIDETIQELREKYKTDPEYRAQVDQAIMAIDSSTLRDMLPEVPPPAVLARKITPLDVHLWPRYFITGPGQEIASTTECDHGYFLTDSCPGCP